MFHMLKSLFKELETEIEGIIEKLTSVNYFSSATLPLYCALKKYTLIWQTYPKYFFMVLTW